MSAATTKKHPNLYKRVTASVPLLVTVIVHVVLIGIAGYFVVSEQIIGKKKTFEAVAATESVAQKQVEHRLQVARKGGGSASSSPVSASRIFSTAENALQMPSMPDLPSVGASSLGGMGFGKGMGAVGTGTGYGTGISTSGGLGRGFMSLSFLGTTSQKATKIIFIVDVGKDLLDIRKGGFEAFKIIREEIMKLISRLPPSAEFDVVLYERGQWRESSVSALAPTLVPATVGNKQDFFDWMTPVNASPDSTGLSSAKGHRVRWTPKELPTAGLDETLNPPEWARALHFALEMQPDVIYVISGNRGGASHDMSPEAFARATAEYEKNKAEKVAQYKRDGIDFDEAIKARNRAYDKAREELKAVNEKLRAKGQSPFIVTDINRIFQRDFQEALRKAGFPPIKLDTTGWVDKQGKPIEPFWGPKKTKDADFNDLLFHIAKLQRALLKDSASINYFLFVGPDEKPQSAMDDLTKLTGRNGGKFQLLTTKRLQELTAKESQQK
jgi:hypothetical protein